MATGQHGDPHMLSDNGNAFNGDHFNRSLHEVVGFYIRLEVLFSFFSLLLCPEQACLMWRNRFQEFYMFENVALAIRINEQGDSLTGSMVDDIFFILQKCARRASETGMSHAANRTLRIRNM